MAKGNQKFAPISDEIPKKKISREENIERNLKVKNYNNTKKVI